MQLQVYRVAVEATCVWPGCITHLSSGFSYSGDPESITPLQEPSASWCSSESKVHRENEKEGDPWYLGHTSSSLQLRMCSLQDVGWVTSHICGSP